LSDLGVASLAEGREMHAKHRGMGRFAALGCGRWLRLGMRRYLEASG